MSKHDENPRTFFTPVFALDVFFVVVALAVGFLVDVTVVFFVVDFAAGFFVAGFLVVVVVFAVGFLVVPILVAGFFTTGFFVTAAVVDFFAGGLEFYKTCQILRVRQKSKYIPLWLHWLSLWARVSLCQKAL
jgi:hypothetical protein